VSSRSEIGGDAIGCVGMLAVIIGAVSYLHMHLFVELDGQAGRVTGADPAVGGREDCRGLTHAVVDSGG
jgi:hypothetical protein